MASSMACPKALLPVLLLLLVAAMPAGARPPAPPSMVARLQGEGSEQCWESLTELRSCSLEIMLFFLNGEAYLGPTCCQAIRVIEQHCWAADAMMAAIGFTPEEGDMLKGYCDAEDGKQKPKSLPPPPPPPVVP